MCPILFKVGPFTVYSYGLMLAIGFIVASYTMTLEYRRKKLDANLAGTITLLALVGGVAGSKILYLLEHWNYFVLDPAGMAFSPGGLSYFGGFFLATLAIYLYGRSKKIPFLTIADGTSPGLMIGYGIARLVGVEHHFGVLPAEFDGGPGGGIEVFYGDGLSDHFLNIDGTDLPGDPSPL